MPIYLLVSEIFAIFAVYSILDLVLNTSKHKPPPTEAGLSVWAAKHRGRSRCLFFLIFRIFLENYLQIRKSRHIFALEIGSQTIGKEI